jgi:predicted transglutaminase-like protease
MVFDIIKDQRIKIKDQTVPIKTWFGWVFNGETDSDGVLCNILHVIEILIREICTNKKYPDQSNKTKEVIECDDHLKETTFFNEKHRVVVKMPLRSNCQLLDTRRIV